MPNGGYGARISSDRYGRKKILILLAVLTICSISLYIFSTDLAFTLLAVVIVTVGSGGSAGGGQGGGPFSPVEQALLAEKCRAEEKGSADGVTHLARVVPFGISPTLHA